MVVYDPVTTNRYRYDGSLDFLNVAIVNKFVDDVVNGLV